MFLKSYTELPMSFEEVRAAMLRQPQRWLSGLADAAERDGRRLLIEVGLQVGGRGLSHDAWLEVGEPITTDRVASLPIRLHAEGHERLFPSLEGTLDAAWLGTGRTYLALTAQYDPPFGGLGHAIDRALLHRVAEAVGRRFLEAAAERLQTQAASGSAGPHLKHLQ
jgi:hypothetical protein